MKKTFSLRKPGLADQRVVEAIKRDLRRYVNRERAKTPPANFDAWEFRCQVGVNAETAAPRTLKEISAAIDAVAMTGAPSVYIELRAEPVVQPRRGMAGR